MREREGVSDGFLLPATLYQPVAPFSYSGQCSDNRAASSSHSPGLLGNFQVEYFESLELYPTTLELRSSLRSLGRF